MTIPYGLMAKIASFNPAGSGSIPRRGGFYNHCMLFLSTHNRADGKYKFRYNISFFIDSVEVSVLAR